MVPDTEFECANQLYDLRWPKGLTCRCGGRQHRRLAPRPRVFVCRACRRHTSVTAGTLMHGCHVPMRHWFVAAELMSRFPGVTAAQLARVVEVSYETAWQLLHRMRKSMLAGRLSMLGALVSAWRAIRTGRPYRDGGPAKRFANHSWVLSIVGPAEVAIGHIPQPKQVSGWLTDRLNIEERPATGGAAEQVVHRLWIKLQYVHRGVSERWLPRYISEAETRANERESILGRVVNARRSVFEDLRPAFE